ncbi:hypothetical protein HRG_004725 [Hirsutella rhossiliensis]|uniref:Uncharacterized protein n=1 Tax=Hirsutella rhossiliensis TaxID=111463 RepID=A0A9P8N0D1_9HYPO|nr:uncharacterized protein HRG_04725 [Hirsutella rhossiliensis]KAH0964297.1 hypothetical protein HRG_04725 [Hirsutella rhossiliensis]
MSRWNPPLLGTRCSIFPGHKICLDGGDALGKDAVPAQKDNVVEPPTRLTKGFNTTSTVQPAPSNTATIGDVVLGPDMKSEIRTLMIRYVGNVTEEEAEPSDEVVMPAPARAQTIAKAIESAEREPTTSTTASSVRIQLLLSAYMISKQEMNSGCSTCLPGAVNSQGSAHATHPQNGGLHVSHKPDENELPASAPTVNYQERVHMAAELHVGNGHGQGDSKPPASGGGKTAC